MKRIISVTVVLALLVGLLAVPASAAGTDVTGTLTVSFRQDANYARGSSSYPSYPSFPTPSDPISLSGYDLPVNNEGKFTSGTDYLFKDTDAMSRYSISASLGVDEIAFAVEELSGSISVYVSLYPDFQVLNSGSMPTAGTWTEGIILRSGDTGFTMYYTNSLGDAGLAEGDFEPFGSDGGVVFKASTIADELEPLSNIRLVPSDLVYHKQYRVSSSYNRALFAGFVVTSARILTTETSADTEALESIADSMTQQNEMLQAFYGDIIAILNQIYTRLGDLKTAADLMNSNLQSIITALGGLNTTASNIYSLLGTYLHYLESIAQTAEDIKTELASFHADFLTYVQLLISTVSSESDDIQAKMEEIYNLLIQYLNTAFGGAVTDEVTEGIEGADNQLDAIEGIESNYTGSLSDKWQSIGISDFTIAPGLLSGVAWVSSWWTNLFEATGDFKVILTLGLFFGVCGLLIGMISRSSRRAGGGGGDA